MVREDKPNVQIINESLEIKSKKRGGAAQIPQSTNWLNKYCIIKTITACPKKSHFRIKIFWDFRDF